MPRLNAANNARTTLVQAVGTTDTTIYVQDVTSFPSPPFRITIDNEIMEVTAVDTTTKAFTVLRAQEGTTATSHLIGATVENRWTAGTYAELAGSADLMWDNIENKPTAFPPSAHNSTHATGGSDPLTPADIGAAPSSHTHPRSQITDFAHKSTHATGGSDALTPADIGAASQSALDVHLADKAHVPYAVASGSANAYTVTINGITSYQEGLAVAVKINIDNTGPSTLNVNSLGAKPIKKQNGNDVSAEDLKAGSIYTLRYNGTNFILQGEGGIDSFFGDGSDGVLDTTENVIFSVTPHTGIVIKQYQSIKINAGHIVTVDNPCRGLILYSQGDVVISGTIDMSKKAGFGSGEIPPLVITKSKLDKYNRIATVLQALKGGNGGNGGYGGGWYGLYRSSGGTGGPGRLLAGGYGGGGGGGCAMGYTGGNGGSIPYADIGGGDTTQGSRVTTASSYTRGNFGIKGIHGSGGSGAVYSSSDGRVSGTGGKCNGGGGGGSGGVSETSTYYNGDDGEYAGGAVIIISGGNVTINSGGVIAANGGNGGNGSNAANGSAITGASGGGGGGGAGGGIVAIFYKGSFVNNGTIQVNGGVGGSGGAYSQGGNYGHENGAPGTSGSVGTIYTEKIV